MNRKKFLSITAGSVALSGVASYLLSDTHNFVRADIKEQNHPTFSFKPDEKEIIRLASLAPSGHNTQPWFIKYKEPYHWIIGNDKNRWLPGVDPTQRETILSIGAFMQNLEYAANHFGYDCAFQVLATTNQDEDIAEVRLTRAGSMPKFDIEKIKNRRTVRSDYLHDPIQSEDVSFLTGAEPAGFVFISNNSKEYSWLNEHTIEANRVQAYRNDAQEELSQWTRFSGRDAEKNLDGLTTASMEITGIPGWIVRNFYSNEDVLKKSFRDQTIDKIANQVASSGGWLLITSKDYTTATLLETGRKFERLALKTREKNIAIHPMTQILEETNIQTSLNKPLIITDPVQFILRTGYIHDYPPPVSLRRPVEKIVRL